MAIRYHINLVREEAAARRRKTELARCATFSELLLAALLILTYACYLSRDHKITVIEARVQYLVDHMEQTAKFTPAQVDELKRKSRDLAARLSVLTRIVDGITPWPDVLMALDDCCRQGQVRLKQLAVRSVGSATMLAFESTCPTENQVASIEAFLGAVRGHAAFAEGKAISISNESEDVLRFKGEVRLRQTSSPNTDKRRESP